jgi:hypothetical protein
LSLVLPSTNTIAALFTAARRRVILTIQLFS